MEQEKNIEDSKINSEEFKMPVIKSKDTYFNHLTQDENQMLDIIAGIIVKYVIRKVEEK